MYKVLNKVSVTQLTEHPPRFFGSDVRAVDYHASEVDRDPGSIPGLAGI